MGFLQSFFAGLPSTNHGFKLRLACVYLASRSINGDVSVFLGEQGLSTSQSVFTGQNNRSRPAPRRAQPKGASKADSDAFSAHVNPSNEARPSAEPFPLPAVGDVLELLALPIDLALNENDEEDEDDLTSGPSTPDAGNGQHPLQLRIRLNHATATVQLLAAASTLVQPRKAQGEVQEKWVEALGDGSLRKAFERALGLLEDADDQAMDVGGTGSLSDDDLAVRRRLIVLREGAMTMLDAWEQQAPA